MQHGECATELIALLRSKAGWLQDRMDEAGCGAQQLPGACALTDAIEAQLCAADSGAVAENFAHATMSAYKDPDLLPLFLQTKAYRRLYGECLERFGARMDHLAAFRNALEGFFDAVEIAMVKRFGSGCSSRKLQQRFDAFMEKIPAFVTIKGRDERVLFTYGEGAAFFGRDSLVGLKASDLIHGECARKLQRLSRDALETGYAEENIRFERDDGSTVPFRVITFLLPGDTAQNDELASIYIDLTRSEENDTEMIKLKTAVEAAPFSIIITDIDGNIEYVNPAFCQLTGYAFEEIAGENPRLLKSGYTDEAEYRRLWGQIAGGVVWSGMFKNIKKNGDEYWEQATIGPIRNREGEIVNYLAIKQEVGEQLQMRDELRQKEEMLISQSRHAAMGEMIGMIAHQWRQPISIIAMAANNMLADIELGDISQEEMLRQIEGILIQTERLSRIIQEFQDFFRTSNAKANVSPETIMREGLKITSASFEHSDIAVTFDATTKTSVWIYAKELLHVYLGILKNAKEALVEHRSEGRRVMITLEEAEGTIITTICDNAGGIDARVLPRIFEPYFSTKEEKNGIGLGLYMSKVIIENHFQGTITVSTSHEGSCFTVTIPLIRVAETDVASDTLDKPEAKGG